MNKRKIFDTVNNFVPATFSKINSEGSGLSMYIQATRVPQTSTIMLSNSYRNLNIIDHYTAYENLEVNFFSFFTPK